MALVTLLTDFGTQDEYVGVMKGVMATIHPDVRIVDICHRIDPQDIVHGAFILAAASSYFPDGTVHVAVVDPGVGTMRRILAADCGSQRFVVPDNGLLERVLKDRPLTAAVSVENEHYFLKPVSQTFHGRDIFAPVAAHLAAGLSLSELGPAIDLKSMVTGVVPRCRFLSSNRIEGVVVAVDHFGNLMTNIDSVTIDSLAKRSAGKALIVEVAGKQIDGIVASYDHVARHDLLAVIGSRGLMEISVNCGNARQTLDVDKNDRVWVRSEEA